MSIKLAHPASDNVRVIRFTLGVVIAIFFSFTTNWALAFITPILTAKFLGNRKPQMPVKALIGILAIVSMAFILAYFITATFLPFPIVFILITIVLIYWLSYWGQSGGNELAVLMSLIAIVLIPMFAISQQDAALSFIGGFIASCLASLTIYLVCHALFPNVGTDFEEKKEHHSIDSDEASRMAFLSTIIITPPLIFFFYFNLNSAVLILVFIVILGQKPELYLGVQGSKGLLLGNLIGGAVAILVYGLLIISPTLPALVLVSAVTSIVFGRMIFSTNPLGPLFSIAITTVIVLISMASLTQAEVDEKFLTRIVQMACACFYIIMATTITHPLLMKIKSDTVLFPRKKSA